MSDTLAWGDIASQIDALVREGGASELRAAVVALQQSEDDDAREAGRLWGAALGAIIALGEEPGDRAAERLQQAMELFVAGLDAWLSHMGAASERVAADASLEREPLWADVFVQVSEVCAAGRRALDGEAGASRVIDRHLDAARRTLRALKTAPGR
jgi:hypothetical protein